MPSVRVRRNTATVAQLVPPERLQNLPTSSNGNTTQREEATTSLGQGAGASSREGNAILLQDDAVVQLAPPIAVSAVPVNKDSNQRETPSSATIASNHATTIPATDSPSRQSSGTAAPPAATVRKRPRSRTIQAIFPPTSEPLEPAPQSTNNTWPPNNLHVSENTIHEEPSRTIISPSSPTSPAKNRISGDGTDLRRSLSQQRTHRAETIARARGISISSTSGAAPVGIRLPPRDQSQVEEAILLAGSPTSASASARRSGQAEGAKGRPRSASIALGLTERMRLSGQHRRGSGERERRESLVSSFSKAEDGTAGDTPAVRRARARTVAGTQVTATRGRAGSVGLMSYFGLTGDDGVEAKMQSWEDSRRDMMEKGVSPLGVGVLTPPQETGEEGSLDEGEGHDDEVVEHLDVIDPEIAAVSHLQNMANSIMIPYFPELYSRKPMLDLPTSTGSRPSAGQVASPRPADASQSAAAGSNTTGLRLRKPTLSSQTPASTVPTIPTPAKSSIKPDDQVSDATAETGNSDEKDALDEHVKDVLHKSKKEWLKRSMKGVWAFLKTPMGIITGIYGFMVVFWGAALVLFLLGWIKTGSKNTKDVWVERCSQIENGLFTVTGVGFIPWRVMDVYRIFKIWQLKRLSVKLRKKRGLPPIEDPDDLPDPKLDPTFVPVLSEYQQALLEYEQERFMASQTWYRPHATETHRAFSINWALWICSGKNANPLHFACTSTHHSSSIIHRGERTKKKEQVEEKLRKALGMDGQDGQEGLLENADKPAQTSTGKAEERDSNDSDMNGDIGNASPATFSEGRDSQRLLAATEVSPMNPKAELQHTETREEFVMQEEQS
ncbi:hypothetical protein QFC21_004590 [Naganishia friedmannii]|uniref:Uncharacterized protein n=1 Tax=Naganishia friedmannii TaxID=89922 RepID=A0ACC2VI23_9TREE|nr:hypothetical protein QFC21_004590 [Naganishia friedmannii]